MILSSIFSAYQIAVLALTAKEKLPDATADEIGMSLDFTLTMIEDLDIEDAGEYIADLDNTAGSIVDHIVNIMRPDAALEKTEEVDTSWINLAA